MTTYQPRITLKLIWRKIQLSINHVSFGRILTAAPPSRCFYVSQNDVDINQIHASEQITFRWFPEYQSFHIKPVIPPTFRVALYLVQSSTT
jgi:hypothetical protein